MQRPWRARNVLPTDDAANVRHRLHDYWAGQLQPRPIGERLSLALARTYVQPATTGDWPTPMPTDIAASLRWARDIAPRPDGILYSGWRYAGPQAHATHAIAITYMTATGAGPTHFSDAIAAFPPKGAEPHDPPSGGQSAQTGEHQTAGVEEHRLQNSGIDDQLLDQTRHEDMDDGTATRVCGDARPAAARPALGDVCKDPHDAGERPGQKGDDDEDEDDAPRRRPTHDDGGGGGSAADGARRPKRHNEQLSILQTALMTAPWEEPPEQTVPSIL